MADYMLRKEVNDILEELSMKKSKNLLCPILKVMQMRHHDLDLQQATKVIRDTLKH